MRCCVCNTLLSDYEATIKHKETGMYLDMCNSCRRSVMSMAPFEVLDRPDLIEEYHSDEEDFMDSGSDLEYNNSEGTTET